MHLAYFDDSDTKAKAQKWQVMSAVIIEDKQFKLTESFLGTFAEMLMGPELLETFTEFHACELYGGYGVFQSIKVDQRHQAIRALLSLLEEMDVSVVFGAVDLNKLESEVYGSADPNDMCFRSCLLGIEEWAHQYYVREINTTLGEDWDMDQITEISVRQSIEHLIIAIVDECDGKIKQTLLKTFRSFRHPKGSSVWKPHNLFHDDMYFGSSRYSTGIQLADLCSYFITKHLEGDAHSEEFYHMIEPRIAHSCKHPLAKESSPPVSLGQPLLEVSTDDRKAKV